MIYALAILIVVIAAPVVREAMRRPMDGIARATAEGQFVQLSQGITHYQWLGPMRGPVAVCIHGLTTPSFVWRGLARGLAKLGYRVLVYDLYGRGFSDRPRGAQDRAFFLAQLQELLDDQGVRGDFTLIGYSMGGAIATCFAAAHPDRVRQLVLLAPAGLGTRPRGLNRIVAGTPLIGDWLMLAVFPSRHRNSIEAERDMISSVDNIVELQQRELQFRGYIRAILASLRGILSDRLSGDHAALHRAGVPVLAVWGREDAVIPLKAMGRLAELNRNARQEVVDGAGHGLVYTHTEPVLRAMRAALRDGLA